MEYLVVVEKGKASSTRPLPPNQSLERTREG